MQALRWIAAFAVAMASGLVMLRKSLALCFAILLVVASCRAGAHVREYGGQGHGDTPEIRSALRARTAIFCDQVLTFEDDFTFSACVLPGVEVVRPLPIAAAFDVIIETSFGPLVCGTFACAKGSKDGTLVTTRYLDDMEFIEVEVVLVPNRQLAMATFGHTDVAGRTVRLGKIRVGRLRDLRDGLDANCDQGEKAAGEAEATGG